MGHEWGQRVMVPQMNRVVPAGDDAPDVTPLPEHIASALKQRGYGAPVDRAISADERKTKSAKPSTKKSKAEPAKEKLADPEE